MSNATNLSHIDSSDSNTRVKAILSSSCVPIYELNCSENYFVNDTRVFSWGRAFMISHSALLTKIPPTLISFFLNDYHCVFFVLTLLFTFLYILFLVLVQKVLFLFILRAPIVSFLPSTMVHVWPKMWYLSFPSLKSGTSRKKELVHPEREARNDKFLF